MTRFAIPIVVLTGVFSSASLLIGQAPKRSEQRARYPSFEKVPAGIFFDDAFKQGLIGPRPNPRSSSKTKSPESHIASPHDDPTSFAWSSILSAATIEDEIKSIKRQLDESLSSAGQFKGRGYKQARVDFSVAAMLFAIIDQYDGDVRWKKSARTARDLMARAAANAKIGTTSVYQEAKQRQLDFQDLVGGAALSPAADSRETDWSLVCDRGPLMKRLEQSQQDRMAVWLASEQEFANRSEDMVREAQLMAGMAEVLTREGMIDADDDDYTSYCRQLKNAALEIVDAVERRDHEAARQLSDKVRKSCSDCHELYRA